QRRTVGVFVMVERPAVVYLLSQWSGPPERPAFDLRAETRFCSLEQVVFFFQPFAGCNTLCQLEDRRRFIAREAQQEHLVARAELGDRPLVRQAVPDQRFGSPTFSSKNDHLVLTQPVPGGSVCYPSHEPAFPRPWRIDDVPGHAPRPGVVKPVHASLPIVSIPGAEDLDTFKPCFLAHPLVLCRCVRVHPVAFHPMFGPITTGLAAVVGSLLQPPSPPTGG